MYEELVSERLAQLRTRKGVSARDMSLSIGQNPGYINNIETGKALPSMSAFFFICEYLGVTPEEFFDTRSKQPAELAALVDAIKQLTPSQFSSVVSVVSELAKKH